MSRWMAAFQVFVLLAIATRIYGQVPEQPARQSIEDAWWTGPMLAPSAATLPRGHFLIEPYLYDVTVQGRYDRNGVRRETARSNDFGSLTYILYGLTNRVSVGLIPTAGYNRVTGGPSSSGPAFGDVTAQAQYRLTQFREGRLIPTMSLNVQETFPSGRYDRLTRPSNGFGSGIYATALSFYSQTYFWLPNHRILRMRFNVSQNFPGRADVTGASVYGTDDAFRGHANPGRALFGDLSAEYSITRKWVLASDATYNHNGNTRVVGEEFPNNSGNSEPVKEMNFGSSEAFGVAPAVEYSWKPNLGVLLGVRLIPAGRNVARTITPAIAINFVH